MIKQESSLSMASCGSLDSYWVRKPKRPIISKIIQRDIGDFAFILIQESSKPIRFLYLMLLTQKNRYEYLKTIISKVKRISLETPYIQFQDMTLEMKQIGNSVQNILKNLKTLLTKLERFKDDQLSIIKFCQQVQIVDPLLILAFRAIANSSQFHIKGALNCNTPMSLTSIYDILRKFEINRDQKNQLNRFVLFYDLNQLDLQFFKNQGITVEKQIENCQQLFDAYLQKYQQQIILQLMYCQL